MKNTAVKGNAENKRARLPAYVDILMQKQKKT